MSRRVSFTEGAKFGWLCISVVHQVLSAIPLNSGGCPIGCFLRRERVTSLHMHFSKYTGRADSNLAGFAQSLVTPVITSSSCGAIWYLTTMDTPGGTFSGPIPNVVPINGGQGGMLILFLSTWRR